jgi:phosphopantetheine adenylyltransferase
MKSFFQFLNEAQSQASMQARKLNLVSDGHGGWLDSRGKFVATTEDGKLKFVDKKKKKAEDERPAQAKSTQAKPEEKSDKVAPKATGAKKAETGEGGEGSGETTETLTVAFGRFNPPTVGHGKLLAAAKKAAQGEDMKIYPSRSQDPKKNPLDPDMKVGFMKKMFPDYAENIVNDDEMKSIFNVLTTADEGGYKNVNIIVGSDRQAEFENLATKYNGDLYNFDNIRVISAGVRDADAEGVEGMSASKMRKAVVDGDFDAFRRGTPKELNDGDTQALFDAVRAGMKIKAKKKEVTEMWEIAPKCDPKGLRDHYVSGSIFNLGDIVENLNTGLIGTIVRRGTNHLICVTQENYMFKSWIRDVMEAVVNYPGPSGVPSNQREVGTDANRNYTMRLTGTAGIKNLINKYKIKK